MQEKKEDLLTKMRDNPWMLTSFVLGILFLGSLMFGINTGGSVNIENENIVGEKVVSFLNSKVSGDVILNSIDREGSFYEIVVSYGGDRIPIYSDLTGDHIFSDIISTGLGLNNDALGSGEESAELGTDVDIEIGNSPIKGDENAPVAIIEFSDYQCPFCAKFYSETLPLIEENYISNGKVKLVFKDFPLSFHPQAQMAAEAARCFAEQGEDYFRYHDKLFENQHLLADEVYELWAVELGANSMDFSECLESGRYTDDVLVDLDYGSSLGVAGTPGFFINGKPVSGAQPYAVFEQLIEAELSN